MLATNKESKILVDILVIFGLSLICLMWFKDGYIINNVDMSWPVEYHRNLIERFSVWQEQRGGGGGYGTIIPGAAYAFFIYLCSLFNFGLIGTQKVVFVLTNFILGLSIYFSLKILWGNNLSKIRMPSIIASFYGMYNLYYSFVLVRLEQNVLSLSWILLSTAIIFSILRDFDYKKSNFKDIKILRWIIISGLFGWTNGVQPPIFYISIISLFFYVIIFGLCSTQSFKLYTLLYIKLLIYFLIVNLWWLIPMFYYSFVNKLFDSATLNERYSTKYFAQTVSENTSPNMVSKGLGDFSWFEGYWPDVDPLLRSSFWQIALSAMTVIILILIYSALRSNVKSLEMYLIFITYIVTLILSIGYHSPFNYLFGTLFDYLPGFNLQRAPWQKFTMFVVSSQILLIPIIYIFVIGKTKNLIKNSRKRNLLAAVVLTLIIFPYTILTFQGKMYSFGSGTRGWHETNGFGYHLKYPDYIIDASNYINSKHQLNNVLLLPDSDSNAYEWGYGGPADITWWLLDSGVLYPNYGAGLLSVDLEEQKLNDLYSEIQNPSSKSLICAMNYYDISAILLRNDFNYAFLSNSYLSKNVPMELRNSYFNEIMSDKNEVFIKKSFKKWELFELKSEYKTQNIYLGSSNHKNMECPSILESANSRLKYNLTKISPSIRILRLIESKSIEKSIDRLVLNEVYDRNWIAFSLKDTSSFDWESPENSSFKNQWLFLTKLTSNFVINNQEVSKLDREYLFDEEKEVSKNVFKIDPNSKENQYLLIYWPTFIVQILAVTSFALISWTIISSILLTQKKRVGGKKHKKV